MYYCNNVTLVPAFELIHSILQISRLRFCNRAQRSVSDSDGALMSTLPNRVDAPREPVRSQWASQDTKSRFWATYMHQAAEHDGQILDKYKSDMDIVLIFAGLFSAVTTSFIVNMQQNLAPDPSTETHMLLKKLIYTIDNSTFPGDNFDTPPWTGPGSTDIWVQSLIYASLSASLLAALGAMLGKQWLNHFQHFGHGTVDGRGRQRQRKLDALYAWHFDAVLEGLPVLLQLSLLLFGVALGANLWTEQHIVAGIVIGTTAFGAIFYALIVVAALVSDVCPFQTPASNRLRSLGQHVVRFHSVLQKGNQTILSSLLRFVSYIPYITIALLHSFASCISHQLSSPYAVENTDAPCIRWLLETSDDPNVIATAANLVPEVEWPPDLDVSCALLRLRDTFLDCFENTQYGQPQLSDFGRDCAIACGKAFLHLYIERRSLDARPIFLRATPDPEFALTSSSRLHDVHWLMWTRHNDPELSFICDLILEIVLDVGVNIPISLGNPKIPNTFLMWMSHPLLHCLSAHQYARFWRRRALDVVEGLLVSPLPPTNVIANCLIAAGLLLDQPVDPNQLASINKGSSIKTLLVSVLESMQQAIGIDIHLELRERSSVYALKLLQPLAAVLEVEQFRQTAYDLGMSDWGVRLCQSLVNIVLHHPELCRPEARDKAWVAARAALHFSVVTAGNGDGGPTDDRVTWKEDISRLRATKNAGCGWLIDYIMHHHSISHQPALTDAFLTMSEMNIDAACREKMPTYMNAMIFAMAPDKSPQLRKAAFRAAYSSRNYLASLDTDSLNPDLCAQFSAALSDAIADSISFGQGDDVILPEYPSMCGKQNLRYLHILFSWTQSELWSHHLYDGGHPKACLSIANNLRYFEIYPLTEHLALYIIAIMARLHSEGEHNLIPDDLCGLLVHKAWAFVALRSHKPLDLSDCVIHEVLEPFAKFTIKLLKCDAELVNVTSEFKSRVMQTLRHLEQGSADSVVISLVEEIVSMVTTT